jgi:uncharacterized membrane protein YkvA (DUF1232 family)
MRFFAALRWLAQTLEHYTLTAYFGARDPRTPLAVRVLALAVAAYALSPIDLIPDAVSPTGGLDDVVLVPLGLTLVVRLLPAPVLADAKARADAVAERPMIRIAPMLMIALWVVGLALLTHGWIDRPAAPDGMAPPAAPSPAR